MRRGLDTNILIYALDSEAGEKHNIAVGIVEDMLKNPEDYTVAAQVLAETLYVVKRKRVGEHLATRLVLAIVQRVPIVSYTSVEVLQSLNSPARHFWDRLLAYTYRNNGVEVIVSEDEKPYKEIIRVENPFKKAQI